MKYPQIIDTCIKIIKTYNPIVYTIDSYSDFFLQKITDDNIKVFIKQVFYGYYRYKDFLQAFNQALFSNNTSTTNRNDGILYAIFTYLIVFRFHELPKEEFRNLVISQNAVKMNVFFQFLFDVEKLNTFVKEQWSQILDPSYIEEFVINGIDEKALLVTDILVYLSEKATGKQSELVQSLKEESDGSKHESNKRAFNPTEPKPFNLTLPKPKRLPEPIAIPKLKINSTVPKTIYKTNLTEIEKQKQKKLEEKREITKKKYAETAPFDFKTHKRPTNLELIKSKVEEEESQKLKFNSKYHKEVPEFNSEDAKIRFNVAAIIKEEHKLRAKEKEEAEKIKNLEINMRDSTEFENWKRRNEEREKIEELEYLQKKKIEMELAREAANKAVEEKTIENKKLVFEMKEISRKKAIERDEKFKEDFTHKLQTKQLVVDIKENANLEKENLILKNKQIHDKNKAEIEDLLSKKKDEEKVERKKREELIKKIRELAKQPKEHTKGFDPTETAGLGILEEMSLEQLRDKLSLLKHQREVEKEEKRKKNLEKKDKKIMELQDKVQFITSTREEIRKRNEELRKEKKAFEEAEKKKVAEIRERSLLALNGKIIDKKENKRLEEEALAKELREIKLKRQYMNANQAKVEEKKWRALQEGAEREIKQRQNDKLIEQERIETINLKERNLLAKAAEADIQSKLDIMKNFDNELQRANKENEELYKEDREEKMNKYLTVKQFEKEHTQNMINRDTYKQKISEMSLSKAKSKSKEKIGKGGGNEFELPPARY